MKLLNVVLFSIKHIELINWYKNVFDWEVIWEEKGDYNYTELGFEKKVMLGITPAKELNHTPNLPRNNSAVMQLEVSNIQATFDQVEKCGGKVLFGPSLEEKHQFRYGGVEDIEGNQIWMIEAQSNG